MIHIKTTPKTVDTAVEDLTAAVEKHKFGVLQRAAVLAKAPLASPALSVTRPPLHQPTEPPKRTRLQNLRPQRMQLSSSCSTRSR